MNRNKTKAKCVFAIKKNGKPYRYMVRVIIRGQKTYLGCYKTEDETSKVYTDFIKYCQTSTVSALT